MKKLKILIDMDGIVCDTLPYWLQKIAEKTGKIAQVEDITEWDLLKCAPLVGCDPKVVFGMLQDPGFIYNIKPVWGAREAVKALQDAGHEIYLVTARCGPVSMPDTLEWVKKHLPFINAEKQVIFCYNKRLIPADVLIDDKMETLVDYSAHHPEALMMAIKYPYNAPLEKNFDPNVFGKGFKLFEGHPDLTLTWGMILGYLRAYAESKT
jgi:5'(3')-deoxyribonucleotidase